MKKRNVVVIVLIIALLLMGSAYAAWTDTVSVVVNAESATLNVLITDRVQSATATTSSTGVVHSTVAHDFVAPGQKVVTETVTNFIPGETIEIVYTIENDGTLPVDLTALTLTRTDTELPVNVSWTIQKFDGLDNLEASDSGTGTDTTFVGIDLNAAGDYCVLTLQMIIDDVAAPGPYTTVQSAAFSIALDYTQK